MESIFNSTLKKMVLKINYVSNINYITDDIKNAFYHVRILLNNTRKKYFRNIASQLLLNWSFIKTDLIKRTIMQIM